METHPLVSDKKPFLQLVDFSRGWYKIFTSCSLEKPPGGQCCYQRGCKPSRNCLRWQRCFLCSFLRCHLKKFLWTRAGWDLDVGQSIECRLPRAELRLSYTLRYALISDLAFEQKSLSSFPKRFKLNSGSSRGSVPKYSQFCVLFIMPDAGNSEEYSN